MDDALTEGAAARVDTDIGTGQTRSRPFGLIGALDGVTAASATCR